MLCNVLLRTDRDRFEPSVVALIDDLTVAGPILEAGIPLVTMGIRPGLPDPRRVLRLVKHLRHERPTMVQTWMDHSNLIGGVAARMAGCPHVVWGIHHSHHVPALTKRTTLLTVQTCAKLSRMVPSSIVCCSEHARTLYARGGFAAEKLTVIPNGFDTARFRPDEAARWQVRAEMEIAPDAILVGLVARYDPLKDHASFLAAAALLAQSHPDVHFLLCGANVDVNNAELLGQIHQHGIARQCHLLGPRNDVARIDASLDIATSSSISEAFPLAVGEAMACGVPCVATNVGDSALIIGSTGRVVPPSQPQAMAAAWKELLAMSPASRRSLGLAARERICEKFDLGAVTRRYESLYLSVVPARSRTSGVGGRGSEVGGRKSEVGSRRSEVGSRPLREPPTHNPQPTTHDPRPTPFKVLMIVESSAGGTGRHVLDLSQGLIEQGCQVHLIYSTRRIDRLFTERLAGIKHLRHAAVPMRTSIHPTDLAVVGQIRRYIAEHGPFDVIHGHSSKGGAIARHVALGTEAAAFYTLHGLIMMDPGLAPWKRRFYLTVEQGLSLRTARIIAVSPEEARAALRAGLGRSRVVLVPNGIGCLELTPRAQVRAELGLSDDALVVGFVGRLVDQKAPHVLIDAFAATARRVPQARLALVGAGPLEGAMRDLAGRLGVADAILWLGERDARGVLAAFDIFALSSRKEGLPYVVLEAMSAGLPIVATRSSGVEILVEPGENGAIVPTDDTDAFAAALTDIAAAPDKLVRYGRASRLRASRFTIQAMVQGTLAAYRSAAAGERTPLAETPAANGRDDSNSMQTAARNRPMRTMEFGAEVLDPIRSRRMEAQLS